MARNRIVWCNILCLACMVTVGVSPVGVSPAGAQTSTKKPVVERSPLLKEPTTPEESFAASVLMVDLARLDLAAKYLDQFQESEPDDSLLLRLRDKHGTAEFLKLAATKELQPGAMTLLEQLNAAARKQAEDPAIVDAMIQRLIQGPPERDLAITELRNAGAAVVPEMLRKMSEPAMTEYQDTFVVALTRMGNQVIPPLIGALDSPDERIRAAVIDTLGWLDAAEAIPYLWFPAFDEQQPMGVRDAARRTILKLSKGSADRGDQLSSVVASNELKRLAKMLYRNTDILPVGEQGGVNLWSWDSQQGTVTEKNVSPDIAALFLSTRFARQSLALSPEQAEPQRQYLASLLGLEVLRHGWEKPRVADPGSAMYLGLTAGEETMAQVLKEALEAGRPSTAVAALEVLSQIGTREQVLSQSGLKSPVIAAINSPDPRVQFAAATTILKLEPKHGFSGSNRVVSILARSLTDSHNSRAIVIDADNRRGSFMTGVLSEGGFEGFLAAAGRDGFEQATTSAGVEVICVHVNCQRWDLTQTLSNLRADARTSAIPIVVYGPAGVRESVSRLVVRSTPAVYVTESATSSDFLDQMLPYMKTLRTPAMSPVERDQQKSAAAYWLANISSGSLGRIFDVSQAEKELSTAAEDPAIAKNALIAIAGIASGSAQRRLSDVALNPQTNEGIRQTAASQLAYHIQRYGLSLTKDEVIDLHSGWKQTQSPIVKSALASVIGSLRPNPTIVGERLRQFPTPPAN